VQSPVVLESSLQRPLLGKSEILKICHPHSPQRPGNLPRQTPTPARSNLRSPDRPPLGPFRARHPNPHAPPSRTTPGDSRGRTPGDTLRFSGFQFFGRSPGSPKIPLRHRTAVWHSGRSSGDNFFGLKVRAWFEVRVKFDPTNTLSMFVFLNN
jgi:hypothetical protein